MLACPCRFCDSQVYVLTTLESDYNKNGSSYIYNKNSVLTFSNKLVEAFNLIRSILNEKEIYDIKKQEQRMKMEAAKKR